jgi:hypothetical protein
MAADDFWARKRKQEEEEAAELELSKERAARESAKQKKLGLSKAAVEPTAGRFEDLIQEAPILIEQLNHLYNQFRTGLLTLPPNEKRGRLAHIIKMLIIAPKPTPTNRFQFSSVLASYDSHCLRWDKMLSDLESGKIKRVTGSKRDSG